MAELQSINEHAAEKADVTAEIVSRGTLVDATMRHDGIRDGLADGNAVRQVARLDLVAFAVDGWPEQQLTRDIGSMMEENRLSGLHGEPSPESASRTAEPKQAMKMRT